MTRIYVPATVRLLAALDGHGSLVVGDEVVVATDESEDAEYDALMTAAVASALLAAELDPGERRRVVVVAEVPVVGERLRLGEVVAVHADAADPPAGVGADDLEDLGWYAAQEIPDLLLG